MPIFKSSYNQGLTFKNECMPRKPQRILGKFQCKKWDFWFFIPDDRTDWGGDFFVHNKHFNGAKDGQRVAAETMDRVSGKKPEARIMEVFGNRKAEIAKKYDPIKVVEWVFSGGNGDFWFVDVQGREEWYFCYGLKKNGAKDGDRVRADIKKYNGKQEAIVIAILEAEEDEMVQGIYSDNDKFGFVKIAWQKEDIFIAGSRKAEAVDGDSVEVKIIKKWGRRSEGIIIKVL